MFYPTDQCSENHPCLYSAVFAYVILAISTSCLNIYWSCVTLVVPEKIQGTAFGIMLAVGAIFGTIFPIAIGQIHDFALNKGYGEA